MKTYSLKNHKETVLFVLKERLEKEKRIILIMRNIYN